MPSPLMHRAGIRAPLPLDRLRYYLLSSPNADHGHNQTVVNGDSADRPWSRLNFSMGALRAFLRGDASKIVRPASCTFE